MEHLKIKRLRESAKIPTRATRGSAGYDLFADLEHPLILRPGDIAKVPTGIAIALPNENTVALVYARSGLASKFGIAPINCVGVVDSDYRGELLVPLTNHGSEDYTIENGDRIAQLLLTPIFTPILDEVEDLDDTERGNGGFGSTSR